MTTAIIDAKRNSVPLSVPHLNGNEWAYVKECLDTNWVSSAGPFVDRFEQTMAARTQAQYAVATSSGTAALHTALLVAGVAPHDEVLVSALTFIAPVNAIRYAGAHPVLVDADPKTWQMDAAMVIDFLDHACRFDNGHLFNKATGRRVKAIMPVHILGHPVDMDPILASARRYNLVVIEDASESLGATYKNRPVGHLGDIGCFSFNGNKIVTSGGGGMIVTDNETWSRKARYLTTQAKDDPVEFVHREIGYNYRLTNIQAALGCAQLEQLDSYVAAKRRIAAAYARAFQDIAGIHLMPEASWAFSAFWLFTLFVDPKIYGMDSRRLMAELQKLGIESRPLWQPISQSPAHCGSQVLATEAAQRLYEHCLSIPSSVGLDDASQRRVIQAIIRSSGLNT
ncbi:MAG: LegC family aminotransferase [Elusimicrobia bacterium]|nr:LegC family aminotransferase [Elusimicrobiota bacterium]